MIRVLAALTCLALTAMPAAAASFDCGKAGTAFERAICTDPEVSRADDILAKSFATAMGGLSEPAVAAVRGDQRAWLQYAQRACTDDAEVLRSGDYDAEGAACLGTLITNRGKMLEGSRMLEGRRFYPVSAYAALPDPEQADDAQAFWKVATHELTLPQLDGDDPLAAGFNAFVVAQAKEMTPLRVPASSGEVSGLDASSDSEVAITVGEVLPGRITLDVSSFWYGHGAAHGNGTVSYLHYYVPEERGLRASDVFTGPGWEAGLLDLAWEQLEVEHKDWLQLEEPQALAQVVTDPTRWSFESPYGLVIQFEPYEVAAYAYGAPTVTIGWDKLEQFLAPDADRVRYGS